jgi:hypothetical protein
MILKLGFNFLDFLKRGAIIKEAMLTTGNTVPVPGAFYTKINHKNVDNYTFLNLIQVKKGNLFLLKPKKKCTNKKSRYPL